MPADMDPAECRSCGAPIYWVELESGKKMPVDRGGDLRVLVQGGVGRIVTCYISHFATCPYAKKHRNPKGSTKIDPKRSR